MTLPNFICVGAPKAATTWLYACLKEHRDIFIPSYKEMHYFIPWSGVDLHATKGLSWYEQFYRGSENYSVRGEVQTQYLAHELAPERISRTIPECKIVVMLRNPIDRFWSHLNFDMNRAPKEKYRPPRELLPRARELKQIRHGFYGRHLERYLKYFSREQIHCVTAEEIQDNSTGALRGLLRFLGADPNFVPRAIGRRENQAREIRHRRVYQLLHGLWGKLAPAGFDSVHVLLKKTGLPEQIKRWNSRPLANAPLRLEERATIAEIYRDDTRRLEELLGRDFSAWYA